MGVNYSEIQELLQQRADCQTRLNLMPYEGNPEIKEQGGSKYLYMRKRVAGKLTSTYVDAYSDELYQLLLRNAKEARELNKVIRKINKELVALGYTDQELSTRVLQNLDFARANMKSNIYDQAVLEGVATSYPQTEDIIENGKVNGVSVTDVQKILNLKHAWEFILDMDVIQSDSNYHMLCHIAKLVNEGFFY
ncbi:MAG: cell filamentation protein Fic, partial [Lachnospiraceae bacterium]|nr:cell filamentation protein Fic [Lachnospiraceae bacterium]